MMYGKGRANKANSLKRSLQEQGFAKSSQNEVWASVSSKFRKMQTASDTSSLNEMNQIFESKTNEYIKAFSIEDNDRGLIYACNDRIIGLDLFDQSHNRKHL